VTIQTNPQVTVQTRSHGPGCLVSGLWFIFFGWWIGGLATLTAWLLGVTIIGLPISLFILNNLPFLLVLQPPSSETVTISSPDGTVVKQREMKQINWFLRALYFMLVGWWWSLIWMVLSYVVCLTIIGLPLGLLMFRWAPAMTTLKRY
jgi:uncharacterized membrane protein YccF (DUF307 family)